MQLTPPPKKKGATYIRIWHSYCTYVIFKNCSSCAIPGTWIRRAFRMFCCFCFCCDGRYAVVLLPLLLLSLLLMSLLALGVAAFAAAFLCCWYCCCCASSAAAAPAARCSFPFIPTVLRNIYMGKNVSGTWYLYGTCSAICPISFRLITFEIRQIARKADDNCDHQGYASKRCFRMVFFGHSKIK